MSQTLSQTTYVGNVVSPGCIAHRFIHLIALFLRHLESFETPELRGTKEPHPTYKLHIF